MSILLLLIPLSLLLLGVAVWAFAWAVRAGNSTISTRRRWTSSASDDETPEDPDAD